MANAEPSALIDLLAVQDHDRNADGLRHQRETLKQRTQLIELEERRTKLGADVGEIEVVRHEIERAQKRQEDEVAMLDDRIAQEQVKLYSGNVTGVKDLQLLQEEIAGLKKRKGLVEDQIIEIMEQAEPVDAQLQSFADANEALDASQAELEASLTAAEAELDVELDSVASQRADRVAGVSPELLAVYDRLRARPGSIGVAKLVGATCHGCHLELAAVEVDRLKKLPADELVTCDECGCILVR